MCICIADTLQKTFLTINSTPPGTVMEVTDKHFAKYMDSFWHYLMASLQNHDEYSVCAAAVGIVGDMCRTFGAEIANFSDKLMDCLLAALSVRSTNVIQNYRLTWL